MPNAEVVVGLVGAGFAASFHVENYKRVAGVAVRVKGAASRDPANARAFAERHGLERAYPSVEALLADPEINLVDLCVPNSLHAPLAIQVAEAEKHVFCEKPLTGYFGAGGPSGAKAPHAVWERAVGSADAILDACARNGVMLCYGENWVYSPPLQKANALLAESNTTILRIVAEESHSGSHSPYAKQWHTSGGGALYNKGCHPLGAAIYLKREEARRKGVGPIHPASVVASVANLTHIESFVRESPKWIKEGWLDCEDWGTMLLEFSDGTVAEITAADITLGGIRNQMTVYASQAVIECNLNPNTGVVTYAPAHEIFGGAYLREKVETHAGWQFANPDEDWMNGFPHECQDVCEAVARGHTPKSDGELARAVVVAGYGAYTASVTGKRVDLQPYWENRG